jgi:hypothetical protein
VPAADDLLARLAAKHARDVGCAEPLADAATHDRIFRAMTTGSAAARAR